MCQWSVNVYLKYFSMPKHDGDCDTLNENHTFSENY